MSDEDWPSFEDIELSDEYDWNEMKLKNLNLGIWIFDGLVSKPEISRNGFVSLGPEATNQTEFIAPLMGDFKADHGVVKLKTLFFSKIRFLSISNIRWLNMTLKNYPEIGNFSFGLDYDSKTRDFHFTYYDLPSNLTKEVKNELFVGISDAYRIKNRDLPFALIKNDEDFVHEYTRMPIDLDVIKPKTELLWTPLKTCMSFDNCFDCQKAIEMPQPCFWCPSLKKCTDGTDRLTPHRNRVGCTLELQSCHQDQFNPMMAYQRQKSLNYKKMNFELHKDKIVHEVKDNVHYSLRVESHTSHRYWHILDNVLQKEFIQSEVVIKTPFPVKLMGQDMEPLMVIQKEGFIYFKANENDNDPLKARLQFISPLRADFKIDKNQGSKVQKMDFV